jgi:Lon protease-like protein
MGLLRDSIRDRLGEILRRMTTAGEKPPPLERLDDLDDARFVNVLAQALDFGVLEKQRLLEAPGSLDRAAILDDLLDFRLAEIDARSASGSDRMH